MGSFFSYEVGLINLQHWFLVHNEIPDYVPVTVLHGSPGMWLDHFGGSSYRRIKNYLLISGFAKYNTNRCIQC